MITCPSCGAQNDPGNRFCDQCGTRLDAPAPAAAPVAAPDQPTLAAPVCPNCGATVLPGEAFCDNCGANLSALSTTPAAAPAVPTAPPASAAADAPTVLATPTVSTASGAPGEVVCRVCGQPNLPGERFCDNCGADLQAPAATTAPAAPDDATMLATPVPVAVSPDDATVLAAPVEPAPAPADPAAATTEPAPAEAAAPVAPVAPVAAPVAPAEPVATTPAEPPPPPAEPVAATPAEPPPPPAEPPPPPVAEAVPTALADVSAERARLEQLLTAHKDTLSQYEQMIARFPAGAAPAFVTAGLDAAKAELAKVEAELAALPSGPAGPDPAEVARLEGLVAANRDVVAMQEQMIARFPAGAAPAYLTAGLDAAKVELAKSEADLAALTGGIPPAPMPATSHAPATAATEAAPAPVAAPAATPPTPAAPAAPLGPRLVLVEGGQTLGLPADKAEIIVGREDPVSNIFPEVDLTPYGGEAGGVSRQHAKITHSGDQWMIIDLNSTNYTRVDGSRLEPNTATPLHDGARIQFGRVAMTFHA